MLSPLPTSEAGAEAAPAFPPSVQLDDGTRPTLTGGGTQDSSVEIDGPRNSRSSARRTLIVDDDRGAAHSLLFALGGYGESVDVALSVAGARRLLGERTFDVVLTDFDMPDGGRRWLAELRAKHPRVKVIVLTGHSDDPGLHGTYGLADTVLHKPTDPEVVLAVIAQLLGDRG